MKDFLSILQLFIALLSVLFNVAGIVAIGSYRKKTNQNIILAYISIIEIFNAICFSIPLLIESDDAIPLVMKLYMGLQWTVGSSFLLGMYILTIDRFVCITSPFKYKARLTRRKIKLVLFTGSFISIICGICVSGLWRWSSVLLKYAMLLAIGFNVIYVLLAMLTYSLVICSSRKSKTYFDKSGSFHQKVNIKKQFLVPGIIIGTFLGFYMVPFAVNFRYVLTQPAKIDLRFRLWHMAICFGMLADPITYIFFCKQYRKSFLKSLKTLL